MKQMELYMNEEYLNFPCTFRQGMLITAVVGSDNVVQPEVPHPEKDLSGALLVYTSYPAMRVPVPTHLLHTERERAILIVPKDIVQDCNSVPDALNAWWIQTAIISQK